MTQPPEPADTHDQRGPYLQDMRFDECMAHLAQERVGRLAVTVDQYPQVFPVNYVLDGSAVVVRTHLTREVLADTHGSVGFEIDALDDGTHSGWSVLVQGFAEDVSDRLQDLGTERARHLPAGAWAEGHEPRTIRIVPAQVTGQVLHPSGQLFATGEGRYL